MKLTIASAKAIRYACRHFHYSRTVPYCPVGYSVFNDAGEWCGVILFNRGSRNGGRPYNCVIGQFAELIRVALNGKQGITTKAVSLAVKLFARQNPAVKILISYADTGRKHFGTIYQAMNWYYEGEIKPTRPRFADADGKSIHARTAGKMKETGKIENYSDLTELENTNKHRYIYPLKKELRELCRSLSKPYPKKHAGEAL